jgi:hypothetical protein
LAARQHAKGAPWMIGRRFIPWLECSNKRKDAARQMLEYENQSFGIT